MRFFRILSVCLFFTVSCAAQERCVVWDKVNGTPVSHASLYTINGKGVLATSSDSNGVAVVRFPFKRLTISHLSYRSVVLRSLTDTVFLEPKVQFLSEVTVRDEEPEWIKEKLMRFLKVRSRLYQPADSYAAYDYDKRNIGDSAAYAFRSRGIMYVPSLRNLDRDSMYQVCPESNVVSYKDTTAGVDFYDMQLMLYENAAASIDRKFVRRHVFRVNETYGGADRNIVQLVFWSPKYGDDRGTLTMDTARCAVLEVSRSTGLRCNLDEKMNSLVLSVVRAAVGLRYEDWTIDTSIRFERRGEAYYPSYVSYKYYESRSSYDKLLTNSKKRLVAYFSTKEATLSLMGTAEKPLRLLYDIPHEKHSAVISIESKRHQRNRVAMEKMPRTYRFFE
ncbi:hypothetical protein C7120_03520 [Prevotella sp. oral taxon 376]|uniref:hypothetical protein n=1 Tax=Prevotella sp. oral taxon 376 TaxID=712466 RepID=UPI000D1EDEEF|nr:hypothetical protein [Prevotella sp. oral taxon 376]PTL33679.1 hypothetical protein C7120_03520 [Prevotella sp. oral taxon 376]